MEVEMRFVLLVYDELEAPETEVADLDDNKEGPIEWVDSNEDRTEEGDPRIPLSADEGLIIFTVSFASPLSIKRGDLIYSTVIYGELKIFIPFPLFPSDAFDLFIFMASLDWNEVCEVGYC